jgi:hypothetical protein
MDRKLTVVLALATALGACDRMGTEAAGGARVSLSLVTSTAAAAAQPRGDLLPAGDVAPGGLDVERVQLLLRDAELKREDDDGCEEEDDACERFRTGPVLVDLPLDSRVVTPFTAAITPGTYDGLRLRIQEPEDRTGERAAFRAEHPDWPRKATVRVTGSFDAGSGAVPFDIFLPVSVRVERDLVPPLVVDAATDPGALNVTVAVDVSGWFLSRDGRPIDPTAAAGDDRLLKTVADNVERSFRALRDDDRDGHDDVADDRGHGHDDHGGDDHGAH